jgi:hypothetical protein
MEPINDSKLLLPSSPLPTTRFRGGDVPTANLLSLSVVVSFLNLAGAGGCDA